MDSRWAALRPSVPDRGQAETIGTVLILALTLIGATATLAIGSVVLDDARMSAQEDGIRHAMTQLDSRTAMVALGDSETQRVPLSSTQSGGYTIDADSGWINITHRNFNHSGSNEAIYNGTLGAVIYENNDRLIAYQGGGVWMATANSSRMISPPEFHYQSATLTLPVIRVQGSSGVAGTGVTAEITQLERARDVYPNSSRNYTSSNVPFRNPVREGNVTVTVNSEFYQAWADYFRTRTSGDVTVDHSRDTVTLELVARGVAGGFEMPADGNSIDVEIPGDEHPITDFSITLFSDDDDSADFSNLKWSLHAEQGGQQFEIHLRDGSGSECPAGDVRATIYYTDNSGADYQSWTNGSAFQYECESNAGEDFNNDGDEDDKRLVANFTSSTPMKYDSIKGGDGVIMAFSVSGSDAFTDPVTFNEHQDTVSWESETFHAGNETDIKKTTNHYLSLMGPSIQLQVEDASGNTVNEGASKGNFEQSGEAGEVITFLHVTENRVSIELD
ncbi:MAG: hypothetical protein ABEH59_11635 [Halobacteriales archaeon]